MTKTFKTFIFCLHFSSLRLHSKSSIDTDGFSVDHLVVDDVQAQLGELVGEAEPRGIRNFVRKIVAHLVGQFGQQRRVEQAWRNRVHSNTLKIFSPFISIMNEVNN